MKGAPSILKNIERSLNEVNTSDIFPSVSQKSEY